jgi:ataxia telangiectasia mutated family protein
VEWVNGTRALHDLLVDDSRGVHYRYREANEMSHREAWVLLHKAHSEQKDKLSELYFHILERTSAKMRYYFYEQYPTPVEWFTRRTTFTRSAAVGSMVGHVVGTSNSESFALHFSLLPCYSLM